MNASAPGKILVCGEYAVLEGAEAVIVAVDRRATARVGDPSGPLSPFLEAAARAIDRELGADSVAANAARRIVVDTSSLRAGDRKLGLGSSAAATVAAIACAIAEQTDTLDRALVHRLAHAAHAEAQGSLAVHKRGDIGSLAVQERGARGSGADVAASVLGGALAVKQAAPDAPLAARPLALPPALIIVPVWTGVPADTPTLVDAVLAHRGSRSYDRAIAAIASAAAAFATACDHADAAACVSAIAAGASALAQLAGATGVALENDLHRELARLAAARGGAAKPTGAGGGDIALAVFTQPPHSAQFQDDLATAGIEPLPLSVEPDGARLQR